MCCVVGLLMPFDLPQPPRPAGHLSEPCVLGGPQVLFARWSQAEAAADSLDGVSLPQAGGAVGRPLVVHFANPRRAPPGQPAEPGVAPRKLFVGQARQGTWAAAVVSAGGGPRQCIPAMPVVQCTS